MKFKLSKKFILRSSLALGVLLWLAYTLVDMLHVFGELNGVDMGIGREVPILLLDAFLVSFIVFYRYRISQQDGANFVDLLWRVFATGLVTTVISLAIQLFYSSISGTKLEESRLLYTFMYHVNFAAVAIFLISTFTVWKRLILYQKSKKLIVRWNIFEGILLLSIAFNFTEYTLQENSIFKFVFTGLVILALVLSANLKWVAYLNFKQKWKSVLLILLITVYLFYFFTNIYVASADNINYFVTIDNLFIISLFSFLLIYSIFSLLVILFNLPTSSVFEQKMEEAINFQRLSQSIQQGENESQIFDILLKSAMSAVYADAGWIEIERDNDEQEVRTKNISRVNLGDLRALIRSSKQKHLLLNPLSKASDNDRILVSLKKSNFKSVLLVPLTIQGKISGTMYLLKEVSDGFNKDMVNIINTFANQASISVENFRLLGDALENERYKEELNIAKSVQRALLPDKLEHDEHFEIHAFTEAAAEVGGDYYDTFRLDDHKFAVVIGDVSGKGTSAAFHMSQMKGIFQSLAQLNLSPKEFLSNANTALSKCLERTSFITLSYFIIDTEKRAIEFARAGHCPTLYYNQEKKKSEYFQNDGLGLGILRNELFVKHIHVNQLEFAKGDILFLYTDGISEAKNELGEEFGYQRMQDILEANAHHNPVAIQKIFIQKLYEFCGHKDLDDDYTVLVIKFI